MLRIMTVDTDSPDFQAKLAAAVSEATGYVRKLHDVTEDTRGFIPGDVVIATTPGSGAATGTASCSV